MKEMIGKIFFTLICGLLLLPFSTQGQTIFIVRHAERIGEPDPPLNEKGRQRAEALARLLADANIHYFYTSDTIRARQTAEPTAARAKRSIEIVEQKAFDDLIGKVRATLDVRYATLVVGHRETVPRIVKALGGGEIEPLRADEHDRLLVLTILPSGEARVITLRYGN